MNDTRIPSLLHDLVHHAERLRGAHAKIAGRVRTKLNIRDLVPWNLVVLSEECVAA